METMLQLLQHIQIKKVKATLNSHSIQGNMHECMLYCTKCNKPMLSKTMNFVECLLFIPSADLGNNGLDRDDLICDYDVFPPKLKWDKFHDYGPTAMFSVQKWYICHIDVFYLKKKDDRIPSQMDQRENISPCLSGRGDAFLKSCGSIQSINTSNQTNVDVKTQQQYIRDFTEAPEMDTGHRTLKLKNEMNQNNNSTINAVFELMLLTSKELSLSFLEETQENESQSEDSTVYAFLKFQEEMKNKDESYATKYISIGPDMMQNWFVFID